MQLIKDKQITQDSWIFISDETELNDDYNIITLNRWQQQKDQLQRLDNLGLRLESDAQLAGIADDLAQFKLIQLHFPAFTDGRAFTHARLLRSRYGFSGDIRVTGDFMRDQVFYLSRVGVNSFELSDQENAQQVIQAMDDFSVNYQNSVA